MFLLRRAAVRAISATPSKAFLAKPRSIATFTPSTLRTHKQQWSIAFQRRFASDDAAKTDAAQAAAADVPENFAQTAAELPMEDGLTPAQQDAQAEPTNEKATIGVDALEEVAKVAEQGDRRPRRPRDETVVPNKQLYIGNLFYEVTADQLKKVFSRFGEVTSVKLVFDNRGLSRGFGYVEFENIEDAQTAIENLDMQVFEGRNLVVQFHREKPRTARDGGSDGPHRVNEPSKTLFIGNMSFEMSDKDLNDLFRNIPNVMDVRVAVDRRTGHPRGFAHADFTDVASATKAKENLGNRTIYGRQLRVDFSASATKDPRDNNRRDDRRDDRRDNRRDDRGYNKRADSGTSE